MAVKKKNSKSFGSEVAAFSLYNEDYEEAMRKAKEEFEAKRAESQKIFNEYEKKYNKILDENYKRIAVEFLNSLGFALFPPLKEALCKSENVEALNAKKDFSVLVEKDNEIIDKVLKFIASDELVRTAIDEYVAGLKGDVAETETVVATDKNFVESGSDVADNESAKNLEAGIGNAESEQKPDDEFDASLM